MLKSLAIALLLFATTGFSQTFNKKILGKWISCDKIELLNRFDTLTFVKEDTAAINKCIRKVCHYTQWNFEKVDTDFKLLIYTYTGCKGASSNSSNNNSGTWSLDKKNVLTIFDDKFTKHVFELTFIGNTEFKLKRIK